MLVRDAVLPEPTHGLQKTWKGLTLASAALASANVRKDPTLLPRVRILIFLIMLPNSQNGK